MGLADPMLEGAMSPRLFMSPLSRRACLDRLYARRRLGSERAHKLAPLHYQLVGERLGYRPNAFFDPNFFRQAARLGQGKSGLIELYLKRPDANAPQPSAEFDHAWYASQNPDWSKTHPHPFLHFLERGLPGGKRPRPDIDLAFVRDVIRAKRRSTEEAAFRVFDRTQREGEPGPPLSRAELKERQDRFYADARLAITREASGGRRKFLVFVQCGQGFEANYLAQPRSYDALLNYYQKTAPNPKADIVVFQAGTKTTAIRRLLELRPDLLMAYEAVLFLDDDVQISADAIDALFRALAQEKLDLAQPALTADSLTAWPFLKQPAVGNGIIRVSSIEIMAPVMTRRALETAGWTFAQTVSGWGTDLLLGPAVRAAFGPASVGVVGSVAVRHARPVDTAGGAFYAMLNRYGIDPGIEANRVAFDFGVDRFLRPLAPGESGPICRAAP
jgi:hypothetical protein